MNAGHSNKARRRTRPAFSLLEVILVLALVAVVAAIAVPRHANALARYRAESAARRLAADLKYARALAEESSGNQTVAFDPVGNTYTLAGRIDPDHPGQPYTVSLAGAPYHTDLVAASFGGTPTVTFNGFGVASTSGKILVQTGSYAYLITVDAASGAVTLGKATAAD